MNRKKITALCMTFVMCVSLITGMFAVVETVYAEDGLILYLKLDGDLSDASGNSNNAECTYGKITFEEGILGESAVFNGKSYIEVADNDLLDLDNFTISLWAYKSDNMKDDKRVPYVYKEKDEEAWSVPYRLNEFGDNLPTIYLNEDESELDQFHLNGNSIDIRKWFLLTVTYDGSEVRLYEDEKLIKKENVSGTPTATLGDLYIGLDEDGSYFKGNMDDLRIYSRAISAKEVAALYNKGLEESPDLLTQTNSLIAHYKFDGNYKDASKFGNDAKLTAGKVSFIDGKNGKAAKFSKGTYLEVLDDLSLDFDEGFSVTGWVNIYEEDKHMALISKNGVSTISDPDYMAYQVLLTHDFFDFIYIPFGYQQGEEYSRYSFDSSLKNKWAHMAVTFDTEEIRWYYNGKMVQKEEVPELSGSNLAHSTGDLTIGSDGQYFFNGALDELKLYNYELSAKEVEADAKRVDSLSISSANQSSIKALKAKSSVTLTTSRNYIETGKSSKLTSGVTYKTSNKKVFTVSSKGVIKAVKKGSANLTITHGAIVKTYKVTVK